MSTLNPNIPSPELSRLLTNAAADMRDYRQALLTPQLLLRTFLNNKDCVAYTILQQLQQERGVDLEDLARRVEQMARHARGRDAKFAFTDDFGKDIPLADEMLVVVDEGLTIAQSREELKVTSGHALAAMAQSNVTTYAVLQRAGVSTTAVLSLLENVAQDGSPILHDVVDEAKKGNAVPVYQRDELLRDLLGLLSLSQSRNVILVGAEGVGKRTLARSLAQIIAEGKALPDVRSLVQISETALLENPLVAMRAGMRRASGGILLVPDIGRYFANRLRAPFPEQVNRELHKAILNEEQIVIGTATQAAYDQLAKERLIRQNSHRLDVPAATTDEAVAMLGFHKERLSQEYELTVLPEALATSAQIASQYVQTIALPASAVQLIERACALVRLLNQQHVATLPSVPTNSQVRSDDVLTAASQMTKIPITKLNEDEQSKYASMDEKLHERIIGQEEAISAVSRAVKTARVGLRDPKRPIGSFLFLGPSGVGKSELAKALAEFMFGTEEAMLVLDMSEYQEEASVNRLIGAPPGYVGFEGGGQLTDFVRERPYTVVLFDEVEKAHPRVLDVLLQVMDEGRLTDGQGRLTTFSETVIIMTSNLGARSMLIPVIDATAREQVMEAVNRFFRPEFLNRLDEVIMFHQLTPEQLGLILGLMLKKERKLTEKQGITLTLTDGAKDWLLAQNDQPEFGARPLRRIIGRFLREPLANYLLSQPRGSAAVTVMVDKDEAADQLSFEMQPA